MIAKDTSRLGATMDVEHSHVVFMGGLKLVSRRFLGVISRFTVSRHVFS
jgi:hypothetical protein